ncbi:MAG TPA: hypothetical protein VHA33_00195 [Candidatus Angelobacter sp.]|nr:hypothetical protein [Candidatus Angelobacter sp.]
MLNELRLLQSISGLAAENDLIVRSRFARNTNQKLFELRNPFGQQTKYGRFSPHFLIAIVFSSPVALSLTSGQAPPTYQRWRAGRRSGRLFIFFRDGALRFSVRSSRNANIERSLSFPGGS